MGEIAKFIFNGKCPIRTQLIKNEPWFVAKDVCDVLGYSNYRDALSKHVFTEDVAKRDTLTGGGKQQVLWINESGLYCLIFGSKLSGALEFKHWITSEVLPSLRKRGSYSCSDNMLSEERNSSLFDVLSCNNDIDAGKQGSEAGSMLFDMLNNQSISCSKVFEELKAFNHNLNQLKQLNPVMLRFFLYSFTASLRYEAMCCEARSRMLMRIEGIVEELSAVNKDENLNKEYKGKACDRLLKRLFKAITGAEKEIEELMVPYALIKKGGAA